MIALPVVVRELRVAARRDSTYWTRLSVAFASIIIGAYALRFSARSFGPNAGAVLFPIFSWIGLLYCISIGLRNSADCISEEKREGTLGLLFLTDLKGYDIVLGKLFATGVHSFYGFLAAFPVFSISLMLGGVTGKQFWQTALALLNIFFYAHAAGLLASTFCVQARKAYGAAVFLTLFLFMGLPFLGSEYPKLGWLNIFNPFSAFIVAQENVSRASSSPFSFWGCLLATHALSWCFLGLSSWRVPYSWQDRATAQRLKWRERIKNWSCGNSEVRKAFRYRLVSVNPYYWLISRERLGPVMIWMALAGGFIFWTWLWYKFFRPSGGGWQGPVFIGTIFIAHLLFKFFVASEASRHLDKQRRDGSLEFLISCTPLQVSEVLKGHWMALRRLFLWPAVVILSADLLMLVWLLSIEKGSSEERTYFFMYVVGAMIMLIADGITLGWLGMWLGLSMKKPKRAAGAALTRVLFLPWFLIFFCGMPFSIALHGFGQTMFVWFLISFGIDVGFASHAKARLEGKFREMAAFQPATEIGVFEKMGQALGRLVRIGGN